MSIHAPHAIVTTAIPIPHAIATTAIHRPRAVFVMPSDSPRRIAGIIMRVTPTIRPLTEAWAIVILFPCPNPSPTL